MKVMWDSLEPIRTRAVLWCHENSRGDRDLVWGRRTKRKSLHLLKPVSIFLDFVERVQTGAKRLKTKPACSHRAKVLTTSVFTLSGQRAKRCWARALWISSKNKYSFKTYQFHCSRESVQTNLSHEFPCAFTRWHLITDRYTDLL